MSIRSYARSVVEAPVPKHDFSDQLPFPASHKKRKKKAHPLSGLVWNVVICELWFARTPSKVSEGFGRANTAGHGELVFDYQQNKDGNHHTANPSELCHLQNIPALSTFCLQKLNGAIQETAGRNLDTFCNLFTQATHS